LQYIKLAKYELDRARLAEEAEELGMEEDSIPEEEEDADNV
jgi:hypothetical protein